MSFIGHNFSAQGIQDLPAALAHVRKTKPNWLVVLDGVEVAKQFKDASPSTNVIVRLYMPDGFHYTRMPMLYLTEMYKQVGDADLWCYVENEAGINPQWNVDLIAMNAMRSKPLKLVILNLSVGTPQPEDWNTPAVLALLKLASEYRQWCAVGLHEYCDVAPTSGLIGGYPDNAGAQPNISSKPGSTGKDLTRVANWPPKDEVASMSKFHAGRAMWLVAACAAAKIPPPRIVLTEIGQDDLGDMEAWVMHRWGEKIRGFRTAFKAWGDLYGQWKEDEAYFNILKYLVENVWSTVPAIEGGCIFCYGHKDSQWAQFDVEGRSDFLRLLEQYANAPAAIPDKPNAVIPAPKPVPVPKPTTAGAGKRVETMHDVSVYTGYNSPLVEVAGVLFGNTCEAGDILRIYLDAKRQNDKGETWVYADIITGRHAGVSGWLHLTPLEYLERDGTAEVPVVKPEDDLVNLVITLRSIPRELADRIKASVSFEIQELVKEIA